MNAKFAFFFIFLLGFCFTSKGQLYLGFQTGVAQNYLHTNIDNRQGIENKAGYGLFAGLPIQWRFEMQQTKAEKKWISSSGLILNAAIDIVQKSYALNRADSSLVSLDARTRNDYLQIPVSVGYYIRLKNNLSFFCSAGFYGGYWLHGQVQGALPNLINTAAPYPQAFSYNESYTFNNSRDQRWEWGWQLGAVVSYNWQNVSEPFLGFNFSQSLSDQQKSYMFQQVPRFNRTYIFSIGVMVNLKHQKK